MSRGRNPQEGTDDARAEAAAPGAARSQLAAVRLGVRHPIRAVRHMRDRARTDSLVRNSLFIIGTTVLNSVLGYAFWILVARNFPAGEVGLAAALVSAMTVTSMVANLGVSPTMVQVLPTRSGDADWSLTFTTGLVVSSGAALVAGTATFLLLPVLSDQFDFMRNNPLIAVLFIVAVLATTAGAILDAVYVAQRAAGNVLARNGVASILKLVIIAVLLTLPWAGVAGVFSPWTISGTASIIFGLLVLIPRVKRSARLRFRGVAREARELIVPFLGHHAITLGAQLGVFLLPVLVTTRLSPTDNAYFYTAWMLGGVFFIISPAVAYSLFAESSHETGKLLQKARSSVRLISIILLPLMMAYLVGGRILLSLFGPEYARHSLGLLVILVFSAIPDAITNVYVVVLRVERRLGAAASLNISMSLGALVLAWFLLPHLGIAGAGLAWLIMQTVGSVAAAVDLRFHKRAARVTAGEEVGTPWVALEESNR